MVLSWCLPGASPGCPNGPFLPGASPVSKCFSAASRVSVAQDPLPKGPRGLATRVESRFWTGAGFFLNFSTTSMANGSVRGKSWVWALRPAARSTGWPLKGLPLKALS